MLKLSVAGVRCDVEVSGSGVQPESLALFERMWAGCLGDERPADVTLSCVISSDSAERASGAIHGARAYITTENAFDMLTRDITLAIIEHSHPEFFCIHAGAVASPKTGAVIGLLGASGAGKSTAVHTLCSELSYVTDELLLVDWPTRTVTAFPKPLAQVNPQLPLVKTLIDPSALNSPELAPSLTLQRLLILDRDPERVDVPSIEPLDLLEAIQLCVPQMSYLMRREQPVSDLIGLLGLGGGVGRVRYRDASELGQLFSAEFSQPPQTDNFVPRRSVGDTVEIGRWSVAQSSDGITVSQLSN